MAGFPCHVSPALLFFLLMLKLVYLNARGLRCPETQRVLFHQLCALRDVLAFLQETNFYNAQAVAAFRARFPAAAYFFYAPLRSCGVGVLVFRSELLRGSSFLFDSAGHILSFDFYLDFVQTRALNGYAPARMAHSSLFFPRLEYFVPPNGPFLLVGDFSCVFDLRQDVRGPGRGRPT